MVPFRARLVFVAAVLFLTHVSREQKASVSIAVQCGAALRVLTEKADESDAIFAKRVFVFLSCPEFVGATRSEGGRSQDCEDSFLEGPEQIVCALAKGEAGNLRGRPKPAKGSNC
jgi:hypothetical protein